MNDAQIQKILNEIEQVLRRNMDIAVAKKTDETVTERTDLRTIHENDTSFDILGVDVVTINKAVSGTKKDGTEWLMQSIQVADFRNNMILLVAWDEMLSLFNEIDVGDTISVTKCFRADNYKGKIQVNLGKFAKVEVKKFSGDQHRL